MGQQEIAVAELFAGVGGFRLGLEGQPESEGAIRDSGSSLAISSSQARRPSGRAGSTRRGSVRKDITEKASTKSPSLKEKCREAINRRFGT